MLIRLKIIRACYFLRYIYVAIVGLYMFIDLFAMIVNCIYGSHILTCILEDPSCQTVSKVLSWGLVLILLIPWVAQLCNTLPSFKRLDKEIEELEKKQNQTTTNNFYDNAQNIDNSKTLIVKTK